MINLNLHLSANSVWNFSNNLIPSPKALIGDYVLIIDKILLFPRSGWLLRNIPANIAESVSAHCIKVAIATHLIISQEHFDISRQSRLVLTAWLHDLWEWKTPDYTPYDLKNWIITKEWKYQAELESFKFFWEIYNDSLPEKLWVKLEACSNEPEYDLIHQLDKMDAAIMALNYASFGFDVDEFFPYTRAKLKNKLLISAFDWLILKEFPEIDYFYQYCIFLVHNWDLLKIRTILGELN